MSYKLHIGSKKKRKKKSCGGKKFYGQKVVVFTHVFRKKKLSTIN